MATAAEAPAADTEKTTQAPGTETTQTTEAPVAGAAAAAAAPAADTRTDEQKEAETYYSRAKFLHASGFGPDPDKELVRMADGTDERGRQKFKQWDFRKTEEVEKVATTETAEDTEKKEPEVKAAETEVPKPKKAKKKILEPATLAAPVTTAEDTEALAERVAEKTAARLQPAPAAVMPEVDLTPVDQRRLAVLEAMEQSDPAYKGIKDQTLRFWKAEVDYVKKWEDGHPGEVFDDEAEEHQAFYSRNNPAYKHEGFDEDFAAVQQAQITRAEVDKAKRTWEQEHGRKIGKLETQMRMRDELPEINQLAHAGKSAFVEAAIPEVVKEIVGEGNEFGLTEETVNKLEEVASPLEMKVVNELADELGLQLSELERLSRYGEHYAPNEKLSVKLRVSGKEVYPHRDLLQFAARLEADTASDPKNERGGKKFQTSEQFDKRVREVVQGHGTEAQKRAALEAIDARYYRLSAADVKNALIAEYGARAQERIKELNEIVALAGKKNGSVKGAGPGKGTETTQTTEVPGTAMVTAASPPKPKPPSSASASDRSNAPAAKPLTDAERLEIAQRIY